jgi:membrane protease YdiL (CAAX protease family)
VESFDSRGSAPESTIPSSLQSVGIVFAALLVVFVGQVLFQLVTATLFFTGEQQAQMGNPDTTPFLHHPVLIVMGQVIPELLLGVALLAVVTRRRMPIEEVLPLRVPGIVSLVGALLLVFGLTPLVEVVYGFANRLLDGGVPPAASVALEQSLAGAGPLYVASFALGFAVVPALVEESLFRGLVTAAHRRSFWAALFAPSILFGLFHVDPAVGVAMALLGVGFGLARLFSGSLFTSIFAHASYNTVVIVSAHLNPGGTNEPSSASAVVVGLLVAVAGLLLLPMGRVVEIRPGAHSGRAVDDQDGQ